MSVLYVITPFERPAWRFEANDFIERIQRRWPTAQYRVDPDRPMPVEVLIRFDPPHRDLGVALHPEGWFVSLEPSDRQAVAEFAAWYGRQLPATDPPVYLSTQDVINLELGPHTTEDTVLRFLDDPQRFGLPFRRLGPPVNTEPDPRGMDST